MMLDGENQRQPTAYPPLGTATPAALTGTVTGRTGIVPGFAAPALAKPTHEQIAGLAYSYWEARGRQGGSADADWLRAEQQLRG
jgi:hypothetical protein